MGTTGALGMADAVNDGLASLRQALSWHLSSNHFPPVPAAMIGPCVEAIEAAQEDDWDCDIELPDGVAYRDGRTAVPAHLLVESFHLDAFIAVYEDDEPAFYSVDE